MLLISIELHNFRQYRGKQKIMFSSDRQKNVTVILGDNTSGKTTLVQAFNWALYGTSTFKTQDFLLNLDVAREMKLGDNQAVEVEICLNHDSTEYIITRMQNYVRDSRGEVRPTPAQIRVSYKGADGQTEIIRASAIDSTINKILPSDLASYFFFDGERIGNISNKQDVTEAVKGLLGLTVLDNTLKRLDPGKKNSVIGKLKGSMDIAGNDRAEEALRRIQTEQNRSQVIAEERDRIDNELNYYEKRKEQLEDLLRDNQSTAALQNSKKKLEDQIKAEGSALELARNRLIVDFNTNTASFFARPLMARAMGLLRSAHLDDKGVPNMNASSIDFIIARGQCLCGSVVREGNEAHSRLLYEREFLPPQSIGTMIRTFTGQVNAYNSTNDSYYSNVRAKYEDIYRYKSRIQEWEDEVEEISQKIKGKDNMKKFEEELRDVKERLKEFNKEKEKFVREDEGCARDIERYQKTYDGLVGVSEKNRQVQLYVKYAEAVYEWIKETYESKQGDIRSQLELRVNDIFSKMYHGKREVLIDSKYRVSLMTAYAAESIQTDESRGLETVKNFAFIAGLVDLAREKVLSKTGDQDLKLSSEPYPLVMDAPFSNADEKHVSNISKILPQIAEQVIMVVMSKDWGFAKLVMADRVGMTYMLEKKSETLTYIRER